MRYPTFALVAALCALSFPASAAQDCASIADLAAQLRCFNRAAGGNDVPMPTLPDPTAKCRALGVVEQVSLCLRRNQDGYDATKEYWARLSQQGAETCARLARAVATAPLAWQGVGDCVLNFWFSRDQYRQPQPDFQR